MSKLDELRRQLEPGKVYRRAQLARWSNAVDRHLRQLVEESVLVKQSGGLYYCPKKTTFGVAPADDEILVSAFLKDNRFVITTPNAYNSLGIGTTQLYNHVVVYNLKRHGSFKLGDRVFDFKVKLDVPTQLSREFLMVDLFNNLDSLAEDKSRLERQAAKRIQDLDEDALRDAVRRYGNLQTKKFFARQMQDDSVLYG